MEMSNNNILEKIIKADEEQKKAALNPQEMVSFLLRELNPREKEVIYMRYGLNQEEKETLESVGKKYGITRERVRQIENNSLFKAKKSEGVAQKLADLSSMVIKQIAKSGQMLLEENLLNELLANGNEAETEKNCLRFIFDKFLSDKIEPVDLIYTERAWRIKGKEIGHFEPVVAGIKNILEQKNEPLTLKEIIFELEKTLAGGFQKIKTEIEDFEQAITSYLEISKHFKKNIFDKWGLAHWRTVSPKRMRDKIYLVLHKAGVPVHYKEIAAKINEEKFDHKIAHPATIHNELILDERFVLVGRGIYALQELGYKPGIIAEVVMAVLKEAGGPMTKEEIMKEVLKRRVVKEGSINLTLSNKDVFARGDDGRYGLKVS